jgi:hypothetical protein
VTDISGDLPQPGPATGGDPTPLSSPAPPLPCDFDSIEAALADLAAGRSIVVVDDENRENEGM